MGIDCGLMVQHWLICDSGVVMTFGIFHYLVQLGFSLDSAVCGLVHLVSSFGSVVCDMILWVNFCVFLCAGRWAGRPCTL